MNRLNFKREEALYGPDIRYNDWRMEAGEKERGGGAVLFSGGRFDAVREDYPFGGGGDVEVSLSFCIEPKGLEPTVVHFNLQSSDPERGFFVELDEREIRVRYRGELLASKAHRGAGSWVEHELALATLGRSYELRYGEELLVAGEMVPPYHDNEGWLGITGGGGFRLLSFAEYAIVDPAPFAEFMREKCLYREQFGSESLRTNWVVNSGKEAQPTSVESDRYVFRHMANAVLRERFDGPLAVDYSVRPLPAPEFSAGVTDAIFIWMADTEEGDFPGLLERATAEGVASLAILSPHLLYWVDFGGTNNVTTRLRKNPRRHLMRQYTDRRRLLEPGRSYRITAVQLGERIEFHVDGVPMIRLRDSHPLERGHVGLRAYVADIELTGLEVHRISLR